MCVAADLHGTVDCEAEAHSMVQVAMLCSSVYYLWEVAASTEPVPSMMEEAWAVDLP